MDHIENTAEKVVGEIAKSTKIKTSNNLDDTLTSIIGETFLLGNWEFIRSIFQLIVALFASIKIFWRHTFGERAIGLITPIVFFMLITMLGSFSELYNGAGRMLTGKFINYSYFLLFAKIYLFISIFHFSHMEWRKKFRPHQTVYSYDHGTSWLFPSYYKFSKKLNFLILNEQNFQKYIESGLTVLIGLFLKSALNLPIGTLIMICGLCLYKQSEIISSLFRDRLVDIRDSNFLQNELIQAADSNQKDSDLSQSKIFSKAFVNEVMLVHDKDESEINEELKKLMKNQKLD